MADPNDIHPVYGVPKEMLSCPGCGRLYVGQVCLGCEECKKCCKGSGNCNRPQYISAHQAKQHLAEHERLPPCTD